jgi:hypothetical protein
VFKVTSWRWPQWILFSIGLVYLVSYVGLLSTGRVEQELEQLAASPEATTVLPQGAGRAEALFIVFALLLLTLVAVAMAMALPMLLSAAVAALLNRTIRLPEFFGTVLSWGVLGVVAAINIKHWWPTVEWYVNLLARSYLVALQ